MLLHDFIDFLISVSTYKPVELDFTYRSILQVFAENESASVYQVFKKLTEVRPGLIKSGLDYRNVHGRIKRLVELQQIEQLKERFERGAIHYKITTYGLISYLSQIESSINFDVIKIHKDNSLMQDLIYQFFEDETINSVYYDDYLTISPASLISDYIRDCCRATFDICDQSYFSTPDLENILPSDKIIQDYMRYLVDKPITNMQLIDKEFKEYEMKLEAKMDDPDLMYLLEAVGFYSKRYSDKEYFSNPFNKHQKIEDLEVRAPFPIFDIFTGMFQELFYILAMKINTLVLQMIFYVGDVCEMDSFIDKKTGQLESGFTPNMIPDVATAGNSDAIEPVVQDKKFKILVDSIQGEYLIGVKVFKQGKLTGMKKPI